MKKPFRIVSRKSALALWQANYVKDCLQALYPNLLIEIIGLQTEGDINLESSLAKIGGKGLFVKALEEYLLNQEADIAVHSLKDMPVELPSQLELSAILKREDPRDAFLSIHYPTLKSLPSAAIIGTSSLRRQTQIYQLRNDLKTKFLRGNVDTRIKKLVHNEFDAIILAVAGLNRLGLQNQISEYFSIQEMLPAIGQGSLGIECRANDQETKTLIAPLHHLPSAQCILSERAVGHALNASCQMPIAAFAYINQDSALSLQAQIISADNTLVLNANAYGAPNDYFSIGKKVAEQLLQQGARQIIESY